MCGDIAFEFQLDKPNAHACHCGQCRAWSGHIWASINAPLASLNFTQGNGKVMWWRSSEYARRGHCGTCGSALFWHADGLDDSKDRIAISAGSISPDAGITLSEHIFVADKGAYYKIGDGLPEKAKY